MKSEIFKHNGVWWLQSWTIVGVNFEWRESWAEVVRLAHDVMGRSAPSMAPPFGTELIEDSQDPPYSQSQ